MLCYGIIAQFWSLGECFPCVFAILPNKTADTYRRMWRAIRQALETRFGDIGPLASGKFHIDFEPAAYSAIPAVVG